MGHDVQVVDVAGEDVLDQVHRSGGQEFWVDRGFPMEGGIIGAHYLGRDGP